MNAYRLLVKALVGIVIWVAFIIFGVREIFLRVFANSGVPKGELVFFLIVIIVSLLGANFNTLLALIIAFLLDLIGIADLINDIIPILTPDSYYVAFYIIAIITGINSDDDALYS